MSYTRLEAWLSILLANGIARGHTLGMHRRRSFVSFPPAILRVPFFFILASGALFTVQTVNGARETYVRLWGATGPYDAAITSAFQGVSGTLNRSLDSWNWRNYAAATFGGLAISARETLVTFSTRTHQPVMTDVRWQDDITINSPGLTGQSGVMTITYRVNGYLTFTGSYSQTPNYNRAFLVSRVNIDGNDADLARYELSDLGVSWGSNFLNADRTIQWGFTFGTPFNIQHALHSETAIDGRNGAGNNAGVEVAAVWKGITVQHQGAPLAGFTASSSNVPSWSIPLPPALPKLLSTTATNEIVFTWPEQAACFLAVSPDMTAWSAFDAIGTLSGMFKTVRVPMTNRQSYFRFEPAP